MEACFANAGTFDFNLCGPDPCWLDAFSTGNNVVQYESDGNW
ncbi:beta/gamma crystallin domain-containing protein [Streptomyces yokosukanensis]